MKIMKAKINDVTKIEKLIKEAKLYLKENNVDQWQDGYPNSKIILNDINLKNGYILKDDKEIVAYFAIDLFEDPNYQEIDGKWLNNGDYASLHRLCIANKYRGKGISDDIFTFVKGYVKNHRIYNIKIDTHKDNLVMKKIIENQGFEYCGIITLKRDKSLRMAYQFKL